MRESLARTCGERFPDLTVWQGLARASSARPPSRGLPGAVALGTAPGHGFASRTAPGASSISSAEAADLVAGVSRLQWQPWPKKYHGPCRRSCQRAKPGSRERTCSKNRKRPPGLQDPRDLFQHRLRVGRRAQHHGQRHGVEGVVGEGQRLAGRHHHLRVRPALPRLLAQLVGHRLEGLGQHQLGPCRPVLEVQPRARADLQAPALGAGRAGRARISVSPSRSMTSKKRSYSEGEEAAPGGVVDRGGALRARIGCRPCPPT